MCVWASIPFFLILYSGEKQLDFLQSNARVIFVSIRSPMMYGAVSSSSLPWAEFLLFRAVERMTSEAAGPARQLLFRGCLAPFRQLGSVNSFFVCIKTLLLIHSHFFSLTKKTACQSYVGDVIHHHCTRPVPLSLLKHHLSLSLSPLKQTHTTYTHTDIMPRSNVATAKVFYKGASDDFVVFVDDIGTLNNWRNDRSIPLASVVNGWKIFVTHK